MAEATQENVAAYLVEHYGKTPVEAGAAVVKHSAIVGRAIAMRSFEYYPAAQIADAEDWPELDVEEDGENE